MKLCGFQNIQICQNWTNSAIIWWEETIWKSSGFSVQFILHNCILLEIHNLFTYLITGDLISSNTGILLSPVTGGFADCFHLKWRLYPGFFTVTEAIHVLPCKNCFWWMIWNSSVLLLTFEKRNILLASKRYYLLYVQCEWKQGQIDKREHLGVYQCIKVILVQRWICSFDMCDWINWTLQAKEEKQMVYSEM